MSPRKIFDGNRFGLNQREREESNIARDREQSANLRAQRTNQGTDSDPDTPSPRPRLRLFDRLQAGLPVRDLPSDSGLFQTDGLSPRISLRPAPGQKVISKKNAFIVFGKDRPSTLASGYGGKGALNCDTIDIVVGRMSSAQNVNTTARSTIVNPNFGADAARIYISQLTDVDNNFGIVDGIAGNIKSRSAIGIKADAVRLVGREGVKIVTGKAPFEGFQNGETNSLGGTIKQIQPKIELIAGNVEGTREVFTKDFLTFMRNRSIPQKQQFINVIQPVTRSQNLADGLKELVTLFESLIQSVQNMATIQAAANAALGLDLFPLNIAHKGVAGSASAIQLVQMVINSTYQTRINANMWAANYCEPFGYKYICSRSVYAT
tara:strand:+ start:274 stop:1407 length:1134 start_codon:yes stop_codon:yes gene_type:complete